MGKKRSWFGFVKRLVIPEAKSKEEKKSKRWRWVCGRIKHKHHPALEVLHRNLNEVKEEQRKHALTVAIATAAAAEAAVTAANAAAEVVRLTGFPHDFDYRNQNLAAIKIQSCYRAHLARKALRALKGVVRLQAVIRGQIVRQQIISKLKSLQSIAKTHSKVHQIRVRTFDEDCKNGEKKQFLSPRKELEKKEVELECSSGKNRDYTLFPKQDKEVICLQKQEAIMKREHMKKHSFSHRESRNDRMLEEFMTVKVDKRHLFEQGAGVKSCQVQETENKNSTVHLNFINNDKNKRTHIEKRRNAQQQQTEEEVNSQSFIPRRSFCRAKRHDYSTGSDDGSLPNSPVFPTYMATTESAKAKTRSMSTPKQRLAFLDIYSVHSSSYYKPKVSSWSSFNGELTRNSHQHISINDSSFQRLKRL